VMVMVYDLIHPGGYFSDRKIDGRDCRTAGCSSIGWFYAVDSKGRAKLVWMFLLIVATEDKGSTITVAAQHDTSQSWSNVKQ
jgi:hypothetical protein